MKLKLLKSARRLDVAPLVFASPIWYDPGMNLTVELPDDIAEQLHWQAPESQRRLLELVAVDGYRRGDLSRGQVGELLDLSLWETEALLKEHHCGPGLSVPEYERSVTRLKEYLGR
jgi:predicted HTH domain antitoxin